MLVYQLIMHEENTSKKLLMNDWGLTGIIVVKFINKILLRKKKQIIITIILNTLKYLQIYA